MDKLANETNSNSPLPLIEQVKLAIDESSDVGTSLLEPSRDFPILVVPLVDGNDFPILLVAETEEGTVAMNVRCVEALRNVGEAEDLVAAIAGLSGKRFTTKRRAASLLALLALETNFPGRTSTAGYDSEEGDIFVQDRLYPVNGVLVGVKERLRSLVEHVGEIKSFATMLWSNGLEPPNFRNDPI